MTLKARVMTALQGAGVPYALIGAGALAVHGVTRATFDFDLLVLDSSCLRPDFWASLESEGVSVLPDLPVQAAKLWRRILEG